MSHRPSSTYSSQTFSIPQSQSSSLQSRITQKRIELENLKQLRDLSANLAQQMSALESRLSTLRDGTESVAEVLRNWSGVVCVLGMAGEQLRTSATSGANTHDDAAETDADMDMDMPLMHERTRLEKDEKQLPATLVRIPIPIPAASGQGQDKNATKERG